MIGKVGVALAALVLLVSASPPAIAVDPTPKVTIPIDATARTKFPNTAGDLVDALAYVNSIVNASITPISDLEHYGVPDKWVTMPDDDNGDCEDFALTKMEILRQAGYPAVQYARIRGVVVKLPDRYEGHAILELRMPDGAIMFLDNRFPEPMTRAELVLRGYIFFDW